MSVSINAKGEIVGKLVFIDVNPRRSPKASPKSPRSDGFT
jgi:hypothetical protein